MMQLKTVLLSGAMVNVYLVILGGFIGLVLKKGLPEKIKNTLILGIGLCVFYIGVTGVFQSEAINPIIIILSVAIGAVIGEAVDLDALLNRFADKIEKKLEKNGKKTKFSEGFITATVVFCIGAMTVVGSIDSGIKGDNTTLYSKSLIDGITAMIFASILGIGVVFSAVPVLVIEGGMTVLATLVASLLTDRIIAHISVVGSLLIIAIALNLMKITKIKIMNLLPAVFIPIGLCFIA